MAPMSVSCWRAWATFPSVRRHAKYLLRCCISSNRLLPWLIDKKVQSLGQMHPVQPGRLLQSIRLNHSSDRPADNSVNTAAASASSPDISVSFFSTVRRELRVS